MVSRRMSWVEHVAHMGERRGVYRILVGILEGKRPFGRPRCRWEDNIKMDLQEMGCEAWTGLIWAGMVGTCKCGYEPSGSIKHCVVFLYWLLEDSAPWIK
jgi:hypothetical protein